MLSLFIHPLFAQVEIPVKTPTETLPVKVDTLAPTIKNDTLKADSLKTAQKGDVETTIYYSAKDSINTSLDTKIIRLYGGARIKYGVIELEADEIIINYNESTISATGSLDSLGRRIGYPIFKNGSEIYETRDMTYNFKTKRAKISEVVTKQGDGFLHGDLVYKNEKNELFSVNNAYTTCGLPHPHFRIISKRSKAIPKDKIVSGPFYMEFNDVPIPLGFPFGMFPSQKESASGILIPSYGEERRRGFFLRGGGYFFDINDYVKLAVTSDIFTNGSYGLYINSSYQVRYQYGGAFNFSYTNNPSTSDIEDLGRQKDFRLVWNHSPQSRGSSRFSSSVNMATSSFNANNNLGVNADPTSNRLDNTTRQLSSNIAYSKTFPGTPLSLGINLRQSQDLVSQQVDLPLPDVSFNMNNIYPFKKSNSKVLENFSTRYTLNGTNKITNNLGKIGSDPSIDSIAPFNLETLPTLLADAKKGIRHAIPISTSAKIFKHFTITPSFDMAELWYFEKLDWSLSPDSTGVVVADTIDGFNRVFNYQGSIGMNTRIFGMYSFKKGKVKAIRHILNPSVSYSFLPDFSEPRYNYYQSFTLANGQEITKSRHEGFVYGSSRSGKSSSMGFSLNNNLEMKVLGKNDSTARKVNLLNTLSISSGYNFAATEFQLTPFALAANANVLDSKFNINIGASIDPYQYRIDSTDENTGRIYETRINRYAWRDGFSLGQFNRANLALSTNFSPKGNKSDAAARERIGKSNLSDSDKQFFLNHPDAYVDFSVPWNLRINYNLDYSKTGHQPSIITQTLRFNGDVNLTEKWKLVFNSGFDFESKEFTQTQLGLSRDLHCWQVRLDWTPFGRYQSYSFSIGVIKSVERP
ncbi:MAG: LPS-assembly protein LptD [Flammeovirgaceae bacterium]|nr:LPS-assembly protein LptD [Flammeovirgaceae bacterium]